MGNFRRIFTWARADVDVSFSAPLIIQTDVHDAPATKKSGSTTPIRPNDSRSAHHKRKQTLLTLLDALTELKLEDEKTSFGMCLYIFGLSKFSS